MFATIKEASLAHNTSYDALHGHLRTALRAAHGVEGWSDKGPWIHGGGVFPGHVVYDWEGASYKRKYDVAHGEAGTDPKVTLGKPKKVHVAYVDSKEAASKSYMLESVNFTSDEDAQTVTEGVVLEVKEGTVKGTPSVTTIPVKLIGPGWGSMAYYSKEVLQRDGPSVFKKGTHMMWNHQTATEEAERPEGDLNDLAAVLTEDAHWEESGAKGPGLYSKAKVFSDYACQVAEKGNDIGVSINAAVTGHEGEAEGRTGRIADKFVYAYSTDFVTKAGAGGAPIVPVSESNRALITEKEQAAMTEQEIKAMQDRLTVLESENTKLKTSNADLQNQQNVIVATATVGATLREAEIPFNQKTLARVCANPTMKEGKVCPEWVKQVVEEFSEDAGTGQVTNFGTPRTKESEGEKVKRTKEAEKSLWTDLGVPESGLNIVMGGSN